MSDYKTELQNNNADLQSVLETVSNLPSAGSSPGGSGVPCTVDVKITCRSVNIGGSTTKYGLKANLIGFINPDGTVLSEMLSTSMTTSNITHQNSYEVQEGAIMIVCYILATFCGTGTISSNISHIGYLGEFIDVLKINGDGSFEI